MEELFPCQAERSKVKILDLAAGTGMVGAELAKIGFKELYGLDGSEGMLMELASKNVLA